MGWTSNYQETLKELGLEDCDIGFPEGPDRGMTLLVNKYITRMRATLHTWFANILEVSQLPTSASVHSLYTSGYYLICKPSRALCKGPQMIEMPWSLMGSKENMIGASQSLLWQRGRDWRVLCQGDLSGEPKQADDGKLWTPGAVDFFRIVNEQVSVVEEVSSGEMLMQTGEAVMGIMKEFQVRSQYPHFV